MVIGRVVPLAMLAVWLLVSAGPATAFQAELVRYYSLVNNICQTGITPEITAAYEQARQGVEQARYGGGRDGNFSGVRTPEVFRLDCFQSDGRF